MLSAVRLPASVCVQSCCALVAHRASSRIHTTLCVGYASTGAAATGVRLLLLDVSDCDAEQGVLGGMGTAHVAQDQLFLVGSDSVSSAMQRVGDRWDLHLKHH